MEKEEKRTNRVNAPKAILRGAGTPSVAVCSPIESKK